MKRVYRKKWILVAGVVLLLSLESSFSVWAKVTVRVLEQSKVCSELIRLGEIAEIEGEEEGVVKKLKSIDLGRAPLPGEVREISPHYIESKLSQSSIDLSSITLSMPSKIKVVGGALVISSRRIEEIIRSFITKKMPWESQQTSITVSAARDVTLPPGKINYEIVPPKKEDYLGTTSLLLVFTVDGRVEKKLWVPVQIEVNREVVVSTHPIGRNSIITQGDVRLEKMSLSELPPDAVTDPLEVMGMRAERVIEPNCPLRLSFLEVPPVVKRGALVTIVAETDALKITTQGVVVEDGGKGDMVRVINTNSRREVYARVRDSQTVEVDF